MTNLIKKNKIKLVNKKYIHSKIGGTNNNNSNISNELFDILYKYSKNLPIKIRNDLFSGKNFEEKLKSFIPIQDKSKESFDKYDFLDKTFLLSNNQLTNIHNGGEGEEQKNDRESSTYTNTTNGTNFSLNSEGSMPINASGNYGQEIYNIVLDNLDNIEEIDKNIISKFKIDNIKIVNDNIQKILLDNENDTYKCNLIVNYNEKEKKYIIFIKSFENDEINGYLDKWYGIIENKVFLINNINNLIKINMLYDIYPIYLNKCDKNMQLNLKKYNSPYDMPRLLLKDYGVDNSVLYSILENTDCLMSIVNDVVINDEILNNLDKNIYFMDNIFKNGSTFDDNFELSINSDFNSNSDNLLSEQYQTKVNFKSQFDEYCSFYFIEEKSNKNYEKYTKKLFMNNSDLLNNAELNNNKYKYLKKYILFIDDSKNAEENLELNKINYTKIKKINIPNKSIIIYKKYDPNNEIKTKTYDDESIDKLSELHNILDSTLYKDINNKNNIESYNDFLDNFVKDTYTTKFKDHCIVDNYFAPYHFHLWLQKLLQKQLRHCEEAFLALFFHLVL